MRYAPWLPIAALFLAACSSTPNSEAPAPTDPSADPAALANPIAYDAASIELGKNIYLGNCVDCHNADGRAIDNQTAPDAADLTNPSSWSSDGSDAATFLVIRDGAGDAEQMPAFEFFLDEEQIWHLVNYLKSIRQ